MTCGGHLLQVLEDSKGMKKERWVRDNPGQMVITAGQIAWTAECEAALADAGSARKKLSTSQEEVDFLPGQADSHHSVSTYSH